MDLLVQNAQVYKDGALHTLDVCIEDGVVARLASAGSLAPGRGRTVDGGGCLLAPGFTDLHTHLRQPGFAHKETVATGTAAAAAGGFTTVCAMPNLSPVPDAAANLEPELAAVGGGARVRVLPYGALTVGEAGAQLADIAGLAGLVCGFSDDGRGVQNGEMMRRAMQAVAAQGRFVAAHCEDEGKLPSGAVCVQADSPLARANGWQGYPNSSEWSEVERDIRLCEDTGCALHICHASTEESFLLVRAAKAKGLPVSCEVTPHNLLLCCDDIPVAHGEAQPSFKMNPPLRYADDRSAALAALLDGTIDAIATDHAPHTPEEKAAGFQKAPPGVVGLETAFPALYTKLVQPGHLPLERLLRLLNEGPCGVLGMQPNAIDEGRPADLVLLDLATERPVQPGLFLTKGRATPFEGWRLKGWPLFTFAEGKLVYSRAEGS